MACIPKFGVTLIAFFGVTFLDSLNVVEIYIVCFSCGVFLFVWGFVFVCF